MAIIRGQPLVTDQGWRLFAEVLALEEGSDRDHSAVSVKRGELIVGHVSRELSRKVWHFLRCTRRASDVCPAKSFAKVRALTDSYIFVGMIMMVLQQTKLLCKLFLR